MAITMKEKSVRFHELQTDAEKKLMSIFPPERVSSILSILNSGEQRILSDCWEQLHHDLLQYPDPHAISIHMFMIHFHNYAS
jgi:hypothetical protein